MGDFFTICRGSYNAYTFVKLNLQKLVLCIGHDNKVDFVLQTYGLKIKAITLLE